MLYIPKKSEKFDTSSVKELSDKYGFEWYHETRCFDYNIISENLFELVPSGANILDAGGGGNRLSVCTLRAKDTMLLYKICQNLMRGIWA